MAEDLVVGFTTIESLKRCFSQVEKNSVANLEISCSGCCCILTVLTDICSACCFLKAVQRVGLIGLAIGQPNQASEALVKAAANPQSKQDEDKKVSVTMILAQLQSSDF